MSYPKPPDFTANSSVKKKRPKTIAVIGDNCTGCEVCVPFCPVNCIDHEAPPGYPFSHADPPIAPIRVRAHECIGCGKCAKACEVLTWNAIEMVATERFEADYGVPVTDSPFPADGVPEAVCTRDRTPAAAVS